jgi:formate dehydrogenase (coenzyme F420) beta subunit
VKELRDLARRLLTDGTVDVVVGWQDSPRGARPVFVDTPDGADQLIFDTRCVHNLATYLNPRRKQVTDLGKLALVVKGCDAKAVAGLLREAQLTRDRVVLIGVRCGGVVEEHDAATPPGLTPETVMPRCHGCDIREPHLYDHLIGDPQPEPPEPSLSIEERIAALEALTPEQRWEYWTAQFAKCVRCYACRQVCPLCVCERCVADKSRPQWIETASHTRGNLSWNVTRAMHLAGRCVGCGECERFCPAGIPLTLLNRKLQNVVEERYDYRVSDDPEVVAPIGDFRLDDQQEFIK